MRMRVGSMFACLLLVGHAGLQLLCQSRKGMESTTGSLAETSLLDALRTEEQAGALLSYTQSYVDTDNEPVTYRGSVYGFIKEAQLHGCLLNINFIIADHFSGVVKHRQTGTLEDDESYSANVRLTQNIADSLSLIEGPPTAIASGTNSLCATRPSCAFTWLEIKAKDSSIRETRTIDGWLDFAGNSNRIVLPISSLDAGKQLIKRIQAFTDARCGQTSTLVTPAK